MGLRGLRAKIAINITIFLMVGMVSVGIVTMMTARRDLIRAELNKSRAISRLLTDFLVRQPAEEDIWVPSDFAARLSELAEAAGAAFFLITDQEGYQIGIGADAHGHLDEIKALTRNAAMNGHESTHLIGGAYGLSGGPEYVVYAAPLLINARPVLGYSLIFSLDSVYRTLRTSQQTIFLFILLNTGVFAFLGVHRVSKLYLQPLGRLAQRAENYKEDELELFSVRKEDNVLQRLSCSLNRLLRRLSSEKEKLRATVCSLETANLELKKAQTEIIRAEKLASVGRLSAGLAHEIGNPIGIVTGYLELLKGGNLSAGERVEYLNRAGGEIERISAIIRQLLEVSRPSQGVSMRVSVHGLIREMADVLNVQPFMTKVRFSTDLRAHPDEVAADPNQLRQVFLNLIINSADAISASRDGSFGSITVTTDQVQNWLRIRFSDDGAGIPAEHLTSVFDPFFTTKEPGKGTGLGLSVSFTIIEGFGGRLEVESEVGRGTCMTVLLPMLG